MATRHKISTLFARNSCFALSKIFKLIASFTTLTKVFLSSSSKPGLAGTSVLRKTDIKYF